MGIISACKNRNEPSLELQHNFVWSHYCLIIAFPQFKLKDLNWAGPSKRTLIFSLFRSLRLSSTFNSSISLFLSYFSSDSFHPIHPQPPLDPPTLDMLTSTHTSSTNCLSSIFCSTPHHSTNRWITFLAPELCTNISWLRERERMKNASARALGATGGFTLVLNCVTGWKNSSVASQAECRSSVSVTITASLLL